MTFSFLASLYNSQNGTEANYISLVFSVLLHQLWNAAFHLHIADLIPKEFRQLQE